jgi:cellulose synthase/poly-beta-1,6-N-acetylglucosamine synthase-like glycosyltransferase
MDYYVLKDLLIKSLYVFLILIGILFILYLPRLIAWFAPFKKQVHYKNESKNKFAVLIPARNESKVIEGLLSDLKNQTYEKNFFDIHIIVKEKSDETIKIAKKYQNTYVHIVEDQKCKGEALNAAIHDIFNKNGKKYYDAYLIMDADCWMDKNCLEELNNAFLSKRDVIQCKKLVKNYYLKDKKISLQASCNGIIWTLIDEMGNRFKSDHNINAMTIGTGICFSQKVINKINGWPYNKTLTEDIEFMYDSILRGFTTYYCSYAKIYMEEAETLEMTNKRRNRWMSGVCDSKRLYNRRLSDECITLKEKINRYYSKALWIVYWLIGLSTFFFAINALISIYLGIILSNLVWFSLLNCLISFSIIYFSFFFMTLFAIIIDNKNIKLKWHNKMLLLFTHPLFYMDYIRIVFTALFMKNNKGWEVIERVEGANK